MRLLAGCVAALAVVGAAAPAASAAAPEGPRLAFTRWGPAPGQLAMQTVGPLGSDLRRVVAGGGKQVGIPLPFGGPSWFPDGSLLAYAGQARKGKRAIFVVRPDGSGMRQLPETVGGGDPVVSPDGRYLAFSRSRFVQPKFNPKRPLESIAKDGFAGSTAWLLDLTTGTQRRLSPWRDGLFVEPSSFSPDGSTLALSRSEGNENDAVALALASGTFTVLAHHAEDPVYSPDGSQIAFVSYRDRNVTEGFGEKVLASELYVRPAGPGTPRRLTRTEERQEGAPSWDPSGQRLAYTQSTGEEPIFLGFTNVIKQINADGSCRRLLYGKPAKSNDEAFFKTGVALHGPSWQPGLGREAGRIDC